jgi:hypothetical protein
MCFPNDWDDVKRNVLVLAEKIKTRNISLLRVNKFIHRETGSIFWRKSKFRFKDRNAFASLWKKKGEKELQIELPPES